MKGVAILQCRTSSSRLPAKALLPLAGIPVVVLAAKRAGNTGRKVIVATSNEPEDDTLARIVESFGIKVIRGSLEDVLDRFITALEGIKNEEPVFRLTADNVFPDGRLLDEMEEDFLRNNIRYMSCSGFESGLPCGVSVEVMTAGELRESSSRALTPYDREHVTPAVVRKNGVHLFLRHRHLMAQSMRCTIDNLDDYLRMEKAFVGVSDPVQEPWISLAERLRRDKEEIITDTSAASKLILGTAQWGGSYGIANVSGIPNERACRAMLRTALKNGMATIDTARVYGESERAIGVAMRGIEGRLTIMTKLAPMNGCPKDASGETLEAFVDASIMTSCHELGIDKIDVVMIHRVGHLYSWNGAVWKHLLKLKSAGIIGRLGVSVQTPDELELALLEASVELIQMPWNLLDWRWDTWIPKIKNAKDMRRLSIHARSTLLQGLLPSTDKALWEKANVPDASSIMQWLESMKSESECKDLPRFCISAALAQDWVDGVVIGMETLKQLQQNLATLKHSKLDNNVLQKIKENRPILREKTLNPALWKA
jgi:spore coat polysaccharide biosynthesis protein SpsF (cytidylyltransferase family)/aryl-alcohol dehydrogenase-like predicted oxidoreductase